MKRITLISALVSPFLLTGCNFLKVESIGKSTIDTFFSEPSGMIAAGEGLHTLLLEFFDDIVIRCAEMGGDMLNENSINADEGMDLYYNFGLTPDYNATYPLTAYSKGYTVVSNANYILKYGPSLIEQYPTRADEMRRVMAYAYFARAVAHHQECNLYAQPWSYTKDASHLGMPVITYVPGFEDIIPRKTVAQVYAQVIEDLHEALKIFNSLAASGEETSVKDPYHISGIACEAMLARVYLYKNDWENAEKYSSKVIAKVPLSPRSEYVAMFRQSQANKGTETILRMNGYDKTSSMRAFYDPTAIMKFYPDPVVYTWFDDDDVRKELLTYVGESCEDSYAGKSFSAVCKFLPLKSITDEMLRVSDNFILRCSEMYLIHAEALVKGDSHNLSAAADDLRKLIARARGCAESSVSLPYTDASSLEELIDFERRRELAYEGHRQFDIARTGRDLVRSSTSNARVKTLKYPAYNYILPIAQMEMQANESMIQNDGYKKQ
ncbi:MAG: RagB/SusD family nutrient uptake outer membrane protein [Candidatus Cryptobacteroides sp.]|nr:RagB/SusD family nutrient uptake outer membrane protein [Candidatus Cryptobacteroides sp.]